MTRSTGEANGGASMADGQQTLTPQQIAKLPVRVKEESIQNNKPRSGAPGVSMSSDASPQQVKEEQEETSSLLRAQLQAQQLSAQGPSGTATRGPPTSGAHPRGVAPKQGSQTVGQRPAARTAVQKASRRRTSRSPSRAGPKVSAPRATSAASGGMPQGVGLSLIHI